MTNTRFVLDPIARVFCSRSQPIDDGWDAETAAIVLEDEISEETLIGLELFSHLEVIFLFHQVEDSQIEYRARHPRDNASWPKVGIFAQRGKNRPNRLGHTICEISRLEGRSVHVKGLDAIDGTPVLDLKPVVQEFLPRSNVHQPAWMTELMKSYWLNR